MGLLQNRGGGVETITSTKSGRADKVLAMPRLGDTEYLAGVSRGFRESNCNSSNSQTLLV